LPSWEKQDEGLFLYRDSCNVYAVQGAEGTLLINAGTGRCADHLSEVAKGPVTLLLTHHFRDHTDGARRLKQKGVQVLGPYWDQDYLVDPEQVFRERQVWNSYDNRWDRYAPVTPLEIDGWMMDYETRQLAGLNVEVVPTPAATNGAVSYVITHGGRRLAFVGETVCGVGKTGRMAPFQYNYNDLTGAVNLWHSSRRLLEAKPDRLLPSIGESVSDPGVAIQELRKNLLKLDDIQPGIRDQFQDPDEDDIEEVLPHLYRSKYANCQTHFVISDSGRVLTIDFGYNNRAYSSPQKQHLSNRRPFLHGIGGLRKRLGVERIDTALISHFHDDHVNGVPMLQRLFGTEVWASEIFADILENPPRYDRPCLWHEPINVGKRLPSEEAFEWEGIPITLYPMSGHTRFATLICMEIDGTRVAHTGDQIFFSTPDGLAYGPDSRSFTNHVYKNGLDIGCYKDTLERLKAFKPELVITGHTQPYRPDGNWLSKIEVGANAFDDAHESLMHLGNNDVHFGPESQGGKLKPYMVRLDEPSEITFSGWIINPFPSDQTATITLVGPDIWTSTTASVKLGPREQKNIVISITPPSDTTCRRQPVALDLVVGDRPFGQVTEALVTIGHPRF
jgi:glyoxylase-like metal-dependent hydrolase (beta-lactamase superfamily II)